MRRPRIWAAAALLGLAAAAVLFFFDPAVTRIFAPCPFHSLTGYHCPGCGSLRAVHALLHGELRAAFALNPLMVLSIPFLGLLAWKPRWALQVWVPWTAMALLIAYGIARNLPFWPFCLLAPR